MLKYFLKPQIIPLLLTLISISSCDGQTISKLNNDNITQHETKSKGLPKLTKSQGSTEGDNVKCSLHDKKGNLWFGTTGEGVYRYDGKLFTQFTVTDGLSNNCVHSILEDKLGNIWFGTLNGICKYDGKNIISIPIPFSLRPFVNNDYYSSQSTKSTVWSMLEDKSGRIWFGTGDGVYYYNGSNFTRFLDKDGVINKENLHLKMIDCMIEDKTGNIWFASGCPPGMEGVCRFDGKSISSFKPNGDGWIRYIKEDKKGNLWFGGRSHGNFIYDGQNFINFTEKKGIGNPLLVDQKGNIWFSGEEKPTEVVSENGIWCYNGYSFQNYNIKDGMSKYFVWNMLEDKDGNIWIGTRNTGLYRFDGKTFTKFSE